MTKKETHGKRTGSYGSVINTSQIPKIVKTKLLIQQLIDKWVEGGCPLEFEVNPKKLEGKS